MPDMDYIKTNEGLRIKKIEQTYLIDDKNTARVRKITENGEISYVKTVKTRISILSQYENEFEISESDYEKELKNADPERKTVNKTRYAFPFQGHTVEIDVFPFWSDRALLEIELSSENEHFEIPSEIEVIKEVSEDKRYTNKSIAKSIPYDII